MTSKGFKKLIRECLEEIESSNTRIRYAFFIRNGKVEVYPVRYTKFSGVDTWVNKRVHKFFRFKKENCYETPKEAEKAGEYYLIAKKNPISKTSTNQ